MNKMIIAGCAVATAFAAVAMPTKKELGQAQKPVEAATKADLAALKAGQKTAKAVAESHLALAAKAENQAEKYLYYQGAFKLYVRSGEYDLAADAIEAMRRDVKNVSPEVTIELVGEEMRYVADEKAPRLLAIIEEVKRAVSVGRLRNDSGFRVAAYPQGGKSVDNKDGSRTVDGKAVIGCYMWSYRVNNGEATVTGEDGKYRAAVSPNPAGHVAIPSAFGNAKVTCVGVAAFYWCDGMTSVTLPESVTNIEHGAFQGCGGLKTVTIPSGVRNIAKQAFWACRGLETVTMLGERPEVGFNTFEGCEKLKAIHVPANAKSWAGMKKWQGIPLVFDGKETVNGYTWSYWLKDGEATIAGKLGGYSCVVSPRPTEHVVIPSTFGGAKVTSVGGAAFYYCDGMTSVTIPESVTNIEYGAFQRCSGLKSVTIPSGVRNIEGQAFFGCGGLEKVIMCGKRPEVAFNTFSECGKLKAIHVPANAKSWAGMKEWQGIPLVFDAK